MINLNDKTNCECISDDSENAEDEPDQNLG